MIDIMKSMDNENKEPVQWVVAIGEGKKKSSYRRKIVIKAKK